MDNRPCSRLPSTCFHYATEAASFLNAVKFLKPVSFPTLPELNAIIGIRGVREEIGSREEEMIKKEVKGRLTYPVSQQKHTHTSSFELYPRDAIKTPLCFQCVLKVFRFSHICQPDMKNNWSCQGTVVKKFFTFLFIELTPAWLWAVIAISIGMLLVLPPVVFLVVRRVRQQRAERDSNNRARQRSKAPDNDGKAKAWMSHAVGHQEQRLRSNREKDKISLRKKKKAKEAEKKRRREPLGEDAYRMR